MVEQATADKASGTDSSVRQAIDPKSMVNLNMGLLVGSHKTVAQLLDEVATIPGLAGVLLTFDEFVSGTEDLRRAHPAADELPPPCDLACEGRRIGPITLV